MRRRQPRRQDVVTTSHEVLAGAPVTVVIAWDSGWMVLSAIEAPESEPVAVHFDDVCALDASLCTLALRTGQYAIRAPFAQEWHLYGPMALDLIDDALTSGLVGSQVQALVDGTER